MKKTAAIILFLSLTIFHLGAEVFLPLPQGNRSSGQSLSPGELPGIKPSPLLVEPVEINGLKTDIEVYQLQTTLEEIAAVLKKKHQPSEVKSTSAYLILKFNTAGKETRWLFLAGGKKRAVTAFLLRMPGKIAPPLWPNELPPLPGGARADLVIRFPGRNAICGLFNYAGGDPHRQLSITASRLINENWSAAGAENSPSLRGSGDIFIRFKPSREIMWINFNASGDGVFFRKKAE